MTDDELQSAMMSEARDSISFMGNDSEISDQRADNMKRYLGESYGDEREGRSSVISRDVADTVEWILPSLLRIFASGDQIARYEPETQADEQFAKDATDYIGHVFMKDNPGFLILYTWFKDALIEKNGVVKYWWEVETRQKVESYDGLDEMQFTALVSPENVTVLNHSEENGLHSVRIKTTTKCGKPCVQAVPSDEFLISRRAKDIASAPFVGHRTWPTRAELIARGFDPKIVNSLPAYAKQDDTPESQVRWQDDNMRPVDPPDPSMETIETIEGYLEVDYDGDGLPEIVQATLAGGITGKMLSHELWDCKPFASLCPSPLPHKYVGQCPTDMVADLQRIRTVLWRQLMDGTYFAANPQREVEIGQLEKGGLDDVINQKIGGIIRVKKLGAVREVQYPNIAPVVMPTLEYTDKAKQERTGVMPMSTGTDADALQNQSATAVNQMASAASQRIELIARVFAETGVTDLFRGLLKLAVNHQYDPKMIKVRNSWMPVNPSEWNPDMKVTTEVGLGHGNRDKSMAFAMQVLGLQMKAIAEGAPIVTWENIYNTTEKIVAWGGLGSVQPYFTDPATVPPKPPQPDPEMVKVQQTLLLQQQKNQGDLAMKQQKNDQDFAINQQELQSETALREREMQMEAMLKWWQAQMNHHAKMNAPINAQTNIRSPLN